MLNRGIRHNFFILLENSIDPDRLSVLFILGITKLHVVGLQQS